ncbi:hypothetical protein [Biformimicrobium ophioploci]|uniref:Tetratricopeptide repeat protein n=1 Tax=Biformimicrobium ophioploci TaxID=3036711 RepID=A0ABQ6LWX7_9GAMM|nr:hypothetical protein [Microbulbifer sp. NKW57]GMG86571.1 hypothetical protein MNKW57_08920 [Microbulbifer sp. NKW57]
MQAIERANRLHPDNPYQLTLQGRLHEWRAIDNPFGAEADNREALKIYKQAIALRPMWPETRADAIRLKVTLGERDAELEHMVAQAKKAGPYNAAVQSAIELTGSER